MFIIISNMTNLPRQRAGAVSVCQIGAVDVFIPLPILPWRNVLALSGSLFVENVTQVAVSYPRIMRPTNICARLNEEHMSIAPTLIITVPTMIDLVRPNRSPIVKATMAPTKQPMS